LPKPKVTQAPPQTKKQKNKGKNKKQNKNKNIQLQMVSIPNREPAASFLESPFEDLLAAVSPHTCHFPVCHHKKKTKIPFRLSSSSI